MNPHLIIILESDEDALLKQYRLLKTDPLTGRSHESNDDPAGSRLVANYTSDEVWLNTINEYKEFIAQVQRKFGDSVITIKYNIMKNDEILKTIDSALKSDIFS